MIDMTKLPLSITSFREFSDYSMIYVDKTDLVANIACFRNPFFLSRPRRFGKSTLVSTFHELFENGLEKFKGLKIDAQNLWHDTTYKVIHLDFSKLKDKDRDESFKEVFLKQLDDAFWGCGYERILNENVKTAAQYFDARFIKKDTANLVLLIDEYDAPLTAVMGEQDEFAARWDVLSNFFSTVKSYLQQFRFVFITGVTRYSHVSIFSAFNNLKDISFNPTYGAIAGYTQEELEHYFKDYLENAAEVLNKKRNTDQYSYELILELLKKHYDGYCFDEECQCHVYNPWSILNFLAEPQYGFKPYWLDTGGAAPSLLVNYLNTLIHKKVQQAELVDYLDLDFTTVTSTAKLSPNIESIESNNFPFFAILYQAGYFTVKAAGYEYLKVGIPNLEVKKAFANIVLKALTDKTSDELSAAYGTGVKAALDESDFSALKDLFNQILNEFSYHSIVNFGEYAFRDIYKVVLQLIGFDTCTEYQTALGRSDLCFEDGSRLYILEFKVAGSADKVKEKLTEAKAQIRDKKYALRLTSKEVTALAVIIVNEKRDGEREPVREVAAVESVATVQNN